MIRRALARFIRRSQNLISFRLFPLETWRKPKTVGGIESPTDIMNVPIDDTFTLKALRVSESHPWVRALRLSEGVSRDFQIAACAEALSEHYSKDQPTSLPVYLGTVTVPTWLYHIPPQIDFFPWETVSMSIASRFECSSACKLTGIHEAFKSEWPGYGPQNQRSIENHARRLVNPLNSINRTGFLSTDAADGVPRGQLLIEDYGDSRCIISSGSHRVVAARVAGLEMIPVRIDAIVRKSEILSWPGVRNGLFSTDEAVKLFKSFFK